jgi:hypothetical protein
VKNFCHGGRVAGEVTFGSFRHAAAAPGNEGVLRKAGVGIFDLDKRILDSALTEFFDEISELAICGEAG